MAEFTNKLGLKKPTPDDFYKIEDFNENFQKIDDKILTNEGGTISGRLNFGGGYGSVAADKNCAILIARNEISDGNNNRQLYLTNNGHTPNVDDSLFLYDTVDGVVEKYFLYGEHNKPSGTYSGLPTNTTREVTLASTGSAVLIHTYVDSTVPAIAIVTSHGYVWWYRGNTGNNPDEMKLCTFENGILKIKTGASLVNSSGAVYRYHVL